MTGANAVTPDLIRGRTLLNLDSEEDGAIYIGCAGGTDVTLSWSCHPAALPEGSEVCQLSVTGLRGGHSGGDIHEGRANALKLIARTLERAGRSDLRLVELAGGSKRNAIPREAQAIVAGAKGVRAALVKAAAEIQAAARAESYEEGVSIRVTAADASRPAASAAETARIIAALCAIPSGVLGMHPQVPNLVQTSNNLSTATTQAKSDALVFEVGLLTRSSSSTRMDEVAAMLSAIGTLAGAKPATGNRYEGWDPNLDSPVLRRATEVFRKTFGSSPKVAAIHAGLECGIIGRRIGGMDMISFGPRIEGAHSPDERVWVESVARSWTFLKALLADLATATGRG
jgi:dipeptidase D